MIELDYKKTDPQVYIIIIVALILSFLLLGFILQISWNASMPLAFSGANKITYTTALFLIIVTVVLFGRIM